MINFIYWYILITVLGILIFPLSYTIFPALKDRGYAFTKGLGWLFWGYIYWILASLGFLRNDLPSLIFAFTSLVILSAWCFHRIGRKELVDWLRVNIRLVVVVELLFFFAFLGWAFVRASNPEIVATEKPMELAFLNAIIQSPDLPPRDPWLSGYGISYYYFGYVMVVMLAKITGTAASISFNLAVSLLFALSAIGVYGVLYNLLALVRKRLPAIHIKALVGPFFVLIVSNLEGFLHTLHNLGIFWRINEKGVYYSQFWSWLKIERLMEAPPKEPFPFWWWWQASRVVQDFDFLGNNKGDIIDEFPFFSYLLADLHPHVLVMPVVFIAMAFALNILLGGGKGKFRFLGVNLFIDARSFWVTALLFGAVAVLNTWDVPIYITLFAGVYALQALQWNPIDPLTDYDHVPKNNKFAIHLKPHLVRFLVEFLKFSLVMGGTGFVLYFPFFAGFSSQAGGLLPNVIYITRGIYFWIMFAPLLLPIFVYLFHLVSKEGVKDRITASMKSIGVLLFLLLVVSYALIFVISILPSLENINPDAALAPQAFLNSVAAPSLIELIREGLIRRLTLPGTWISLTALLVFSAALLLPRFKDNDIEKDQLEINLEFNNPKIFVVLLILIGSLSVLGPEFVFLKDFFGYRINTIFKFYFQVWLIWSVAASFSAIVLWQRLSVVKGIAFKIGMGILLSMSLFYPILSLRSKTNAFAPPAGWTLDGTSHLASNNPDEYAAMQWLQEAPFGVIAEAVGGSYTGYARMATNSGKPTVLGWDFHEFQWRGGNEEMGSRKIDIEKMYCSSSWAETQILLQQYSIRYVVLGNLERSTYQPSSDSCPNGLFEAKFSKFLIPVFSSANTTIFEVPSWMINQ